VKLFIRISFSLLLLTYFLMKVSLVDTLSVMCSLPLQIIIVSLLLLLLSTGIGAKKWQVLIPNHSFSELLKFNFICLFYNIILPGQIAGEGSKAYFMIRKNGNSKVVITSILVDKITGLTGLLFVTLMGVCLSRQPVVEGFSLILTLIIISTIAFLYILRVDKVFFLTVMFFDILEYWFPKLNRLWKKLIDILHGWREYLNQPSLLFKSVVWGILYQSLAAVSTMIIAEGIAIDIPFVDWCWIIGIVSVVLLLPVTLGGIGIREGTFIGILGLLGIAGDKALSLSLSLFALHIIGAAIGGVLVFCSSDK